MKHVADCSIRVVMFVMNDLLNDPRVQREARSAVRAGFGVTVVAMQSDRCVCAGRRWRRDGTEWPGHLLTPLRQQRA